MTFDQIKLSPDKFCQLMPSSQTFSMMSQETQVEINPSAQKGKLEQLSREINES
jgi:hypothetical protein